ncbi:hypothetical protein N7495_002271 [Penicillium taxi]|uniref:uncharacterized protein n=1 Tax=Penicillium taxi TaxID=168475 RepID=UPI002545A8C5|nr:uncharacterized protein N7495_002271 [Penicillium taxi]KAJ5901743.1 hypothetical protein N7495_002271 [Penicillium taxi]
MRLASVILALASSALAFLPANHACGDSIECSNNCYQGRYEVVSTLGGQFFGCKTGRPETYAALECQTGNNRDVYYSCITAGGNLACAGVCVIKEEYYPTFKKTCEDRTGELYAVGRQLSYDAAWKIGSCSD